MTRTARKTKPAPSWKDKVLYATRGTQTGAILNCAFGIGLSATPRFRGKASITSDGFVVCDFVDKDGGIDFGAFVGSLADLDRNIERLAKHCNLNSDEHNALTTAIAGWIGKDWRK